MNSSGNRRSWRPASTLVGTFGYCSSGQGSANGVSDWRGSPAGERLGDDVRRDVMHEDRHDVECRVGIVAVTLVLPPPRRRLASVRPPRTRRFARRRDHRRHQDEQPDIDSSHSIGAKKAASDGATTMRSARSPSTLTTASVYSPSPALSSLAGRPG
jgi:hypothetical protein